MSINSSKRNFAKDNGLNNVAVIIGIDRYNLSKEKFKPLNNAAKDAIDLAKVLQDSYDYTVHLFTDKQSDLSFENPIKEPTLEAIDTFLTKDLPEIVNQSKLKTCLLFYFAGHGKAEKSETDPQGFLIPQDAQDDDRTTWLEMKKVYEVLSGSRCYHVLAILDSCYAGAFLWAIGGRKGTVERPEFYKEHLQRYTNQPTQMLMYSAQYNQEASDGSRGDKSGNSPFAAALCSVLKNNVDQTKSASHGIITTSQLFSEIQKDLLDAYQQPGVYPLKREFVGREYIFYNPEFDESNLKPAPAINEQNNPYRGLQAFEERHTAAFRGRSMLTKQLRDRLHLPVTTDLQKLNSSALEAGETKKPALPLTIVLGNSGSGKSSLVQAGLLPTLRPKFGSVDWRILDPIRPGAEPFMSLARAFLPIAYPSLLNEGFNDLDQYFEKWIRQRIQFAQSWETASPEARLLIVRDYYDEKNNSFNIEGIEQSALPESVQTLYTEVKSALDALAQRLDEDSQKDEPTELAAIVQTWYQSDQMPNRRLLLVVDQLEELLTLDRPNQAKAKSETSNVEKTVSDRFLNTILTTLKAQATCLQVIMTLRSDFEPRFLTTPLKEWWGYSRFPVRPMTSNELRRAIEAPAQAHALEFEPPQLVGQLIDELGQPGALPLLSFVLSELYLDLAKKWQGNESSRVLVLEASNHPGGVAGLLSRRADAEYKALEKNDQKRKTHQTMMQQVMLRMVAMDGGSAAKRRVPKSELNYPTAEKNKCCEEVIDRFVKARLLVQGRDGGEPYCEPAHDYLILGWAILQDWLKKNQEEFLLQKRLTVAAIDWDITNQEKGQGEAEGRLWKGDPRIEQLEKIDKSEESWLNQLEQRFVAACLEYRDRQARDRLEKEIELSTTESEMHFAANNRLYAVAKMIKAGELLKNGSNITEYKELDFLITFNQLLSECGEINSIDTKDRISNLSCNHKAKVIATITDQYDQICFWDWKGRLINREQNQDRFYDLAFSPDGKILVTAGDEGIIKFYKREPNGWHTFSTTQVSTTQDDVKNHDGTVNCVKFSPDGAFLVSVGSDRNIIFWGREGKYLADISYGHNVEDVAFSPKDKLVAFAYKDKNTGKRTIVIKGYQVYEDKVDQTASTQGIRLFDFDEFDAEHRDEISAIDFSPDGKTLVSVGKDGKLRIWFIAATANADHSKVRDCLFTYEEESISSVAFSPNCKIVVSSHTNGIINVWDTSVTESSHELQKLYKLAGHKDAISRISFTSDGSQLLSSSDDGTVKFWSFTDRFAGYTRAKVQKVSFSEDNQIVTTVGRNGNLLFWQPTGERMRLSIDDQTNHKSEFCDVQLSRDNEIVVAVVRDGEIEVKLYSHNGEMLYRLINKYEQTINSLSFSSTKDIFATASNDNTVGIWRVNRNSLNVELWKTLTGHHEKFTAITLSDDGKFFASGHSDGTVKLWMLGDKQASESISDNEGSIVHRDLNENWSKKTTGKIYALRFYSENRIIVSIDESGNIAIWSLDKSSPLKEINLLAKQALDITVEAAAFSSDGKRVVLSICLNEGIDGYSYRRIQTYNLDLETLISNAHNRIQNYLWLNNIKTECKI